MRTKRWKQYVVMGMAGILAFSWSNDSFAAPKAKATQTVTEAERAEVEPASIQRNSDISFTRPNDGTGNFYLVDLATNPVKLVSIHDSVDGGKTWRQWTDSMNAAVNTNAAFYARKNTYIGDLLKVVYRIGNGPNKTVIFDFDTPSEIQARLDAQLAQARQEAEAKAVVAEMARQQAELALKEARKDLAEAEIQAQNAETARQQALTALQNAQASLATAETNYLAALQTLAQANTLAASEKTARETAEANLQTAKVELQTAEANLATARQSLTEAEAKAQAAEQARLEAEAKANAAEQAKAEADAKAATAEKARLDAEAKAKTAEEARIAAENKAASAETARKEAETKWAAAEQARGEAEAKLANCQVNPETPEGMESVIGNDYIDLQLEESADGTMADLEAVDPTRQGEAVAPSSIVEVYPASNLLGKPALKSGQWKFGPFNVKGTFDPSTGRAFIPGTFPSDRVHFYAKHADGSIWKVKNQRKKFRYDPAVKAAPSTLVLNDHVESETFGAIQYGEYKAPELIFDALAHTITVKFNAPHPVGTFTDGLGISADQVKEVLWIAPYTTTSTYDKCTYRTVLQKDASGNIYAVFHTDVNGELIRDTGIGAVVFSLVNPKINRGALSYSTLNHYKWKLVGLNGGGAVYYSTPDRPCENTLMMDIKGGLDLTKWQDTRPDHQYKGE